MLNFDPEGRCLQNNETKTIVLKLFFWVSFESWNLHKCTVYALSFKNQKSYVISERSQNEKNSFQNPRVLQHNS